MKLAATCRGMTRHANPTWRKGHCHQGQGKDKAVPRTQKGQTFRKRHRVKQEGINGIRNQGLKEQLHLRKKRTPNRIFGKTKELEVAKHIVGTSSRLRKMNVRTFGTITLTDQ
jgi:hypothetical protein